MKHPALPFLLATLALVPAAPARAQVSLDNAATPVAVVGQCPTIPSGAALAAHYCGLDAPSASEFAAKLDALQEQAIKARQRELEPFMEAAVAAASKQLKATTGKTIAEVEAMSDAQRKAYAESVADQEAKKLTGRSVADLQNMSPAEQEKMGMELANKMLAGSGVSGLDMSDLLKMQDMSEEQLLAQMQKKGVTVAGLSIEEIQNLQGMSDDMASVYMQEQGRMDRVQESGAIAKKTKTPDILAPGVTAAQIDAAGKKSKNSSSFGLQILEERNLALQQSMELYKQTEPYWKKANATRKTKDGYDTQPSPEERAAILAPAFDLVRDYIIKRQGRLKSLLPLAAEIDAANKAQLSLLKNTATAAAMQPELLAWEIAGEYLEMTGKALSGHP
ncbi:hypothetical protein OH491_13340 [Termitidicoccus mucosus]|uniref:Uncharacterized protein n=1 Tax=Termitidicoccus mucosus TaxID=1184151 RepID=A0A178IJF9_9BACT|nr:hypothetical protein AW736_14110 [Opitutaceae bacterium TSB47]